MKSIEICFRTTNCYGLSRHDALQQWLEDKFPYNELLWFIQYEYGFKPALKDISVQRIVMVYRECGDIIDTAIFLFPYNELLWFIVGCSVG